MTQGLTLSTVRGEVSQVVYVNDDRSFAVVKLIADDRLSEFVAVGSLAALEPGQNVELSGYWEQHATFGRQLKVESYSYVLPTTRDGIIRFLSSDAIPGVGTKLAKAIVDHFGTETLTILERYSKRLTEVQKIGPRKAEAIRKAWMDSQSRRDSFIFMQGLGLTPNACSKLYNQYGAEAAEIVRSNPYRLAEEVRGIGFAKADEIARSLGVAPDSLQRMTAAT
ncbi:MAG: helix-hairpin-helix domain-containing protein, partial [Victivallaceae bacterium]|nr:helix-hairpin-helix domain-containing protein [Victivallaceae bacterium]